MAARDRPALGLNLSLKLVLRPALRNSPPDQMLVHHMQGYHSALSWPEPIYTPGWYNAMSPSGLQLTPLDPNWARYHLGHLASLYNKIFSQANRVERPKCVDISDKKQTFNCSLLEPFVCAELRVQNKCLTALRYSLDTWTVSLYLKLWFNALEYILTTNLFLLKICNPNNRCDVFFWLTGLIPADQQAKKRSVDSSLLIG